ncbi:MAG: hypothetical protein QF903_15980 [Planctomycetota bacterium]|nr:hypothetical protein [Planctomycetota bacterium]MDP6761577.1 hypothetical protein [Planctomycetota bacterium]MDP6990969.1 hypothetical protein [Planctomycetota bacterium]
MRFSRKLLPFATAAALAGWAPPSPPVNFDALSERVEHFVLEDTALSEGEAPGSGLRGMLRGEGVRGLVEWRRRRTEGGVQLELEVHYPGEGLRLMDVECLTERGPRLVWREVSRAAGRTLVAEWCDDGSGLRVLEWGSDGVLRERTDARGGAVMPLYLLELLRAERVTGGEFLVFDPLGRGLEALTARTIHFAGADGAGSTRRVDLRREDGTLAGRYTFAGESLEEFRWQASAVRARRIDGREYAERCVRYGLEPDEETVKDL